MKNEEKDNLQPNESEQIPTAPNSDFPPSTAPQEITQEIAKKSKAPLIIGIMVASLVFLAIIAVFLLKGPLGDFLDRRKIEKNPKAALSESIKLTTENINATPIELPDFDRFRGKPTEQVLDLSLVELPASYYDASLFEGANFLFKSKKDYDSKKLIANIEFLSPYFTLDNSTFYVTPDQVAFSIPTFYSDHEFITINPNTFTQDWNKSEFNDGGYNEIDPNFNLSNMIESLFEYLQLTSQTPENIDEFLDELRERNSEILEKLEENSEVEFIGYTDTTYEFLSHSRGQDVENMLAEYATLLEDMFYKYLEVSFADSAEVIEGLGGSYSEFVEMYMEEVEYLADTLRDVRIREDVEISVIVNRETLLAQEIELHRVNVISDEYGGAVELALRVLFEGKEYLADNLQIDFTMLPKADSGDNYGAPKLAEYRIVRIAPEDDNLLGSRWELVTRMEYDPEYSYIDSDIITYFFDFSWDKEDVESDSNMSLKLGMKSKSYDENMFITLRGNLIESEERLDFTNGKLSVMMDKTETLSMMLDYSTEIIDPQTINLNVSDSIDFFRVDWEEFIYGVFEQFYNF